MVLHTAFRRYAQPLGGCWHYPTARPSTTWRWTSATSGFRSCLHGSQDDVVDPALGRAAMTPAGAGRGGGLATTRWATRCPWRKSTTSAPGCASAPGRPDSLRRRAAGSSARSRRAALPAPPGVFVNAGTCRWAKLAVALVGDHLHAGYPRRSSGFPPPAPGGSRPGSSAGEGLAHRGDRHALDQPDIAGTAARSGTWRLAYSSSSSSLALAPGLSWIRHRQARRPWRPALPTRRRQGHGRMPVQRFFDHLWVQCCGHRE